MRQPRPDKRKAPIKEEATLDPERPLSEALASGAAGRFLAIYRIGRQLLEQREPLSVIRTIHEAIVEQLRPDHACVLSRSVDGTLRPVASHRLDLQAPFESWLLSHTALERAARDRLAVLALDSISGSKLEDAESIQRLRIRSVMCVPLGRPVRGLIYVDNRSDRMFTRDDLDFLSAVSLYASIVLERAEEYVKTAEALRSSDERLALLQDELLRHEIVGRSPKLLAAYDALKRLARSGARVLLRGETGTGKELFARAYAANSGRAARYVPVPVPALAPSLIESELFGHVRGAFTEATRDKKGRLELADGGVLFLDEVGDIEPALQPKLLRFLDSGELFRVGDTEGRRVDALVVSATNRRLERDIESGRYRADLLARLGHEVVLPPLRERPEDVPLLVEHFLDRFGGRGGRKRFSDAALRQLQDYSWPLNVRELQQAVERACCLVDGPVIDVGDLGLPLREEAGPPHSSEAGSAPLRPLHEVVQEAERRHILRALEGSGGNRRRAIELLGISSETFYRRLEEFGIQKKA